ncbi:hypothetical protein B0H13DRAFT_2652853 [Mycena leptocephala]|nr:hypothetical protein B0H13DRAFT_2652853 [Mycena leptocephala]
MSFAVMSPPVDLPDDLKRCLEYWNRPIVPLTEADIPPPRPKIECEMPPPIPENLRGRECVYGYTISDAFMRAYFEAHPVGEPEPPRTSYLWLPYKHYWLEHVARRVGLDLHLRVEQQQLPALPEDIMYFSYTHHGAVKRKIPKMQYLKRFETSLGSQSPPNGMMREFHSSKFDASRSKSLIFSRCKRLRQSRNHIEH